MAQEKLGEVKKIVAAVQAAVQTPTIDTSPIVRDEPAPPATPELNPRNRAMAEIAARSNADMDANAKETIPPGEEDAARLAAEADPDVTNVAGDQEPQPLPETQVRDESGRFAAEKVVAAAPAGFDTEAEYDLMVEGKQVKVKGSQIIDMGKRGIQKELAADYKLELASNLLKDAQARSQVAQQAAPQVPEKTYLDAAQAIQFGTTEQAAEVIRGVVSKAVAEATQHAVKMVPGVSQDQMAFMEAKKLVDTEYGDLMADPYLQPLFFSEELKRRKAGYAGSYTELYKSIGEDLRKHFNRPKTGAVNTPAPTINERREAKQQAPSAPKLASVRLSGGTEGKKPPSREEIIAGMQASRGMNALTKH